MSFNTAPGRAEYTASAAQTIFTFGFKIFETSNVKVYLTPAGQAYDDATDILIETTDYNISINGDDGGDATLTSGASLNDSITLVRELPTTRTTEYQQNGDLTAEALNEDQDYQTYLILDGATVSERALAIPDSVQSFDTEIPTPVANKLLVFNNAADGFNLLDTASTGFFNDAFIVESVAAMTGIDPNLYGSVIARGYYVANDGGGGLFNYDATQSAVNNGGTVIDGWVRQYEGAVNLAWFGAKGDGITDDTSIIQNAINTMPTNGELVCNNGSTFKIDTNITLNEKGRPDNSVFKFDMTGSTFIGAGDIIFDSCKNLRIIGVHFPTGKFRFRGVWYSEFISCKASELIIADAAGSAFSAVFWNSFYDGVYQTISFMGFESFNANRFVGTVFRGKADQGFTSTKDYFLTTTGSKNMQSLSFNGGDISYYDIGILDIQSTGDVELSFDDIYWDSESPKITGLLPNQYIRVNNGHIAGKFVGSSDLKTSLRGNAQYQGNTISAGWEAYAPLNFMPNGDFAMQQANYSSYYRGPIGSFLGTQTGVEDATYGRYLNLSVGNGDATATACKFRTVKLPYNGKYSGALILRNNGVGTRTLNFSIGGQFLDADVETEWTFLPLSAQADLSAGGTQEILMRSTDGLGYDIDVKYIGFTVGSHPPMICPQHPFAQATDNIYLNKLIIGSGAEHSRTTVEAGSNSPEGVVTAYIGSIFLSVSATADAGLWVKESGSGTNTGWVHK